MNAEPQTTHYKPTLSVDFDGVLHSYESGWQGAATVADDPVAGAMEFLQDAVEHWTVAIFSSRSHEPGGIEAMQEWTLHHLQRILGPFPAGRVYAALQWPTCKPPAKVSLDDRAVCFTGRWPDPLELLKFQPWNRQ